MKHLLTSLMLIVATVVTMSGQKLSRYELNVSDFSELKVVDGVNVDYKCNPDSAGMVCFMHSQMLLRQWSLAQLKTV